MPSPQLQGTLFKYGWGSANVAFKSGSGAKAAIVLGGLTDGFFCCRYVEPLARALEQEGVSVVQTLLSSSYQMYGTSSLDRDAEELAQLVRHLKSDAGVTDYGIVGHSTGCQDAVRFVRHCLKDGEIEKPRFVVLQAPVSDRESLDMSPSTWKSIDVARELISRAQGEDERDKVLMPHSTQEDGAPITARRFLSLATRGGDDDVFSSDFTDEELRSAVGHMEGVPTLVLQSGADEYIPRSVDAKGLAERLAGAMGGTAAARTIEGAGHALAEHVAEAVEIISGFVRGVLSGDADDA